MPKPHIVTSVLMIACMAMSVRAQNPFESMKTFSASFVISGMSSKAPEGRGEAKNLTVTPHTGPRAGQSTKMKVWEAQDLHGYPIKVETQTNHGLMTIEYKDVSLAEPDASHFTYPQNRRPMPGMQAGSPH